MLLAAAISTSCDKLGITAPEMDSEEVIGIIIETLNKNIQSKSGKFTKSAGWREKGSKTT